MDLHSSYCSQAIKYDPRRKPSSNYTMERTIYIFLKEGAIGKS